jgi:alpha-beta hydrolase superfamily lysophospholipase
VAPTGEQELQGVKGRIQLYRWDAESPRYVAVLAHGYAEHAGRYEHVAQALVDAGAVVYAADHLSHGRSEGEPALFDDIEDMVADTVQVVATAKGEYAELPMVLIGHSMGGIIAARYAQDHGDELAALVLSGPAFGGNPELFGLLQLPQIPDIPLDPDWLSRDPEVGRRYAEDPLVYSGPFKRPTLEALVASRQGRRRRRPRLPAHAVDPRRGRPALPAPPGARGGRAHQGRPVRGEDLPRRPPRGLQRDQPGRGDRRHDGLPRPCARRRARALVEVNAR